MVGTAYHAAIDWLYSFADYESTSVRCSAHYNLRRVALLLKALGDPHKTYPVVHVAGSKGKGSTAAMIASVMRFSGYKTGLYTSPHLIDISERIQIDGVSITANRFVDLVAELKPAVEVINREGLFGVLTTFEILTVLAFRHFAREKIEFGVIEVGLGGRLDATNVVLPEVSVITTISLEHTEILGSTLTAIATEKAGIVKEGRPVVIAHQEDEVRSAIIAQARRLGAVVVEVGRDVKVIEQGIEDGVQWLDFKGCLGDYHLKLQLLGRYQAQNAAVAVAALEVLAGRGFNVTVRTIESGLAETCWPGRFDVISKHPLVILDGAHNPASMLELKKAIEFYLNGRKMRPRLLVFGTSLDKDIEGMAHELRDFDRVIVTRSNNARAMEVVKIVKAFNGRGSKVETVADVASAVRRAKMLAGLKGMVVVTGSLFVIGESLKALKYPAGL